MRPSCLESLPAPPIMPNKNQKEIHIQYFASLREQRGVSEEMIKTDAKTARVLYSTLQKKYGFHLGENTLRVCVNENLSDWETILKDRDWVVFIPPVSGG